MNLKQKLLKFFKDSIAESQIPDALPNQNVIDNIINKTINKTPLKDESNNLEMDPLSAESDQPSEVSDPDTQKCNREAKQSETGDTGKSDNGSREDRGCCPYGVKRNIVNSILEARKFAAEVGISDATLEEILRIIAQIVLNALKGKVSSALLLMLLNALNFDKAKEDAFKEGELAGKNAKIEKEYFPRIDDGIPSFRDAKPKTKPTNSIFSIAREA